MVTCMGAGAGKAGAAATRAWQWLLLLALTCLALLSALPAHAQGLPTANLLTFAHTQQAAGATEQQSRTITVPAGVGAPYYLLVSGRTTNDRNRIVALSVAINGTQVLTAADLFRSFPAGGKKIELGTAAANTLAFSMTAQAGVIVDVRVLGTPIPIKPIDLAPNPVAVQVGATVTLKATLSPTPLVAGAIAVVSSRRTVAVPASTFISYAAGQTSINIPVRAAGVGDAVIIVGGTGGIANVNFKGTNAAAAVSSLMPAVVSVERGAATVLTIKLASVRSSATTVTLAAQPGSIVSVPGSITVPANTLSTTVAVSTLSEGVAQVTASLGASRATASVTVIPSSAASIVSLLPPTSSVTLGASAPLTVAISSAQSTSTTITLSVAPAGIVSVPPSVTIVAGQTTASFNATSSAAGSLGNALVRATLNASAAEAAVTVLPPLPTIASLQPSTVELVVGATGTFTLALDAAQASDTLVPLSASNIAVLQAPASVTVPAGRASVEFTASALAAGTSQLSASLNGTTRSASVSVANPPVAVAAIEPASFSVQVGATGSATVRLNALQPQDTSVPISVNPPGVLQLPSSIVVPAGQISATLPVTGAAEGVALVTATLPGGAASTSVNVTRPPVLITGLTPAAVSLAKGRTTTLRLAVSPASTTPLVATLATSAAFISAPSQITIPAGALGVDIPIVAANEGSATLSASLNGSTASASVQVTPPEVQTLSVQPQDAAAFVGDTIQYGASAILTDGTARNETTIATWASSSTAVASVNSSGAAQALANGNTNITASSGGVTAATPLTVLPTPVLTLAPGSASVAVGASQVFTLTTSAAAESGGLLVTLAAGGSGSVSVSVPASVTIAAGQTAVSFTVTATAPGVMSISASAPRRTTATATLTIAASLAITSVTPSSGPVGSQVTLSGSGFDPVAANDRVVFTGATSVGVVATVVSASATQLQVTVPAGAQSGPITLTTPAGSATSPPFTVQGEQDFNITASPAESVLITGTSTTLAIQPASTGTRAYTGLLDIAVVNLPAGVTARLQPATLSTSQTGSIVFTASSSAAAGRYDVLVQASGLTSNGRQTRSATATLVVQGAAGATGVKGRFVTPDGRPIAGVLVRVDAIQTATDAAGNFLLTGLPAGAVTLRFDATPANPLYPIWPYTTTLQSGQIAVIADWTLNPPPEDEKFVAIANATQTQRITDARFPGLEITLPAGVSIIGWDGVPKSRIAVEKIAVDKLPVPMPPVPIKEAYQLYFGTPMGGIPSQPIPVTLPNVAEAEPGDEERDLVLRRQPDGRLGRVEARGAGHHQRGRQDRRQRPRRRHPALLRRLRPALAKLPAQRPTRRSRRRAARRRSSAEPDRLLHRPGDAHQRRADLPGPGAHRHGDDLQPGGRLQRPSRHLRQRRAGLDAGLRRRAAALQRPAEATRDARRAIHDFIDDGSGTYRNSGSRMFDGAVMRAYPAGGPGDWEVVIKNGRTWRFKPFPGITGVIRGGPPLFMTEMVDPAGATLSITRRSDGRCWPPARSSAPYRHLRRQRLHRRDQRPGESNHALHLHRQQPHPDRHRPGGRRHALHLRRRHRDRRRRRLRRPADRRRAHQDHQPPRPPQPDRELLRRRPQGAQRQSGLRRHRDALRLQGRGGLRDQRGQPRRALHRRRAAPTPTPGTTTRPAGACTAGR